MQNRPSLVTQLVREDRLARVPSPPSDPLIARLDHAILSIGALAARPGFHAESRDRAGLGGHHFPSHPARRVDPALYGVLAALDGQGMPGPSSIAVRLGLHPSTVSHHLERLERRGLIERHRFWEHRKWGDMRLTRDGADAYVTLRDARHQALADLLSHFAEDERRCLVEAAARLGDAVRARNMTAHRRYLDDVLERRDAWSPEQKARARRVAHDRYQRRKKAERDQECERQRQLEARRSTVGVRPLGDWLSYGD